MPFGCISCGLYRLPSNHSWLLHWLSAMEHALDLNSSSAAAPDYIFFGFDGASVRPLSYAEALVRLRRMLDMWGGITSLQTLQYTLHSMKVTLLAFFRQLDFSLETRHLQGHHTFAASSTLYGRDDVRPAYHRTGFIHYQGPARLEGEDTDDEGRDLHAQRAPACVGSGDWICHVHSRPRFLQVLRGTKPTHGCDLSIGWGVRSVAFCTCVGATARPAGGTPGSSIGRRD